VRLGSIPHAIRGAASANSGTSGTRDRGKYRRHGYNLTIDGAKKGRWGIGGVSKSGFPNTL
jgi:hypothetical protein